MYPAQRPTTSPGHVRRPRLSHARPVRCRGCRRSTSLTRITEETDLGDGVRIAGELVPITACHDRLSRPRSPTPSTPATSAAPRDFGTESPAAGTAGASTSATGWPTPCSPTSSAATPGGSATGRPTACPRSWSPPEPSTGRRPSCFLHLRAGTAPDLFARVVTALDGYGLGFRAELAGDPDACLRTDAAVITVGRDDVPALARVTLRLGERAPFALAPSVPAFTRQSRPASRWPTTPGAAFVRPPPLPPRRRRPGRRGPRRGTGRPPGRRPGHPRLPPASTPRRCT